jgi:hypothetical protein
MGTSYVKFASNGYWANDAYLEGFSYLLAREFNKLEDKRNWQIDLIDRWTNAAMTGFAGCVPSYFEHFDTHDKVQILRKILMLMLKGLKEDPNFLTSEELNQNKIGNREWGAPNINGFINITNLTLDLMEGRLKTNASSPIDYWNIA